jgi:hypothetical protein
MSSDPSQQSSQVASPAEAQAEQRRRQINQIAEEIAQLAEADTSLTDFYNEFLKRIYFAVQAFAGAIWIRTPQGNLQVQCDLNVRSVGLDNAPDSRPMHNELLRQAALQGKGGIIRPRFSHNFGGGPEQLAGNPTDFVILLVPVVHEKQVICLLEIWQDPNHPDSMLQGVHQFMVRMAAFVSIFNRNYQLRQMLGQQELWMRLESFSRQIHASLHLTEVAYLIANEGRRLVEADRVSVATREGSKCAVTAISGADVVEKRSNLVQLMRALFDAVVNWGEKLVFTGEKDDTLPPKVLHALDAYLAESNSKVLVIMPLHDEREKEKKKTPRSALMMECFETNLVPEQLIARLDVVGRHSCPALYNALEYRRIPMRFLWMPLAHVQDGLGGKAKAIATAVTVGVLLLIMSMIVVPFPLKMDAKGQALPTKRDYVYPPIPGKVTYIMEGLATGSKVAKDSLLFRMFDFDLFKQVNELDAEIRTLETKSRPSRGKAADDNEQVGIDEAKQTLLKKLEQRRLLQLNTNAVLANPGVFEINAPRSGIILSADFRDTLLHKYVKPNEPLVRIGYTDLKNPKLNDWEIELKIPQKHYGQVKRAFEMPGAGDELDVDILFASEPTSSYRARLHKNKIAAMANVQKDDNNEPEPIVLAWARINSVNNDIPEDRLVPPSLLLSGSEVHARIRCGNHAMGYSLFYGVHEFLYEKVVFPYLR